MPIIPSLAGYSSLSMSLFHEQQAPNPLSAKLISPLRQLLDDTFFGTVALEMGSSGD